MFSTTRVYVRQDSEIAIKFLNNFYESNSLLNATIHEKIIFLRNRLGYMHYDAYSGRISEKDELAALERALIAEEL